MPNKNKNNNVEENLENKVGLSEEQVKIYEKLARKRSYRKLGDDLAKLVEKELAALPDDRNDDLRSDEDEAKLSNAQKLKNFMVDGRYANYNMLPQVYKDYYIGTVIKKLENDFRSKGKLNIDDEDFRRYLDENLLRPGFQTALELFKQEIMTKKNIQTGAEEAERIDNEAAQCGAAVEYMNDKIMEDTLGYVDRGDFMNDANEEDILRYNEKQGILATNFVLAHLGGVIMNQDVTKNNIMYKGSVGDLFAHGGRSMFVLPKGEDGEKFQDAIFANVNSKLRSVMHIRMAATHDVDIKKIDNSDRQYLVELKSKGTMRKNRGVNIAVGGYGKKYGFNWKIMDDGKDGHAFFKYQGPTKQSVGYVMLGIEGEAPFKTGRGGNKHDASATKAPISVFGATKHVPGNAYGGRVIDLQDMNQQDLLKFIKEFKSKFVELQRSHDREKIKKISKCLSGPMLDKKELLAVLGPNGLGMNMDILRPFFMDKINDVNPVGMDEIISNQNAKIVANQKKNVMVNPEFSFALDKLEGLKSSMKGDKDAKNIKKQINKVLESCVDGDPQKYKDNLKKLHRDIIDYRTNGKNRNAEVEFMITVLGQKTLGERLRKGYITSTEMKEKYYSVGAENLVEKQENDDVTKDDWVSLEGEDYVAYDMVRNNIATAIKIDINSDMDFLKNINDIFEKVVKLTNKDSSEFKEMKEHANKAYEALKAAKADLTTGRDENKNLYMFNKEAKAMREAAASYMRMKLTADMNRFVKDGKTEKFSQPTQIKLIAANALLEFTKDETYSFAKDKNNIVKIEFNKLNSERYKTALEHNVTFVKRNNITMFDLLPEGYMAKLDESIAQGKDFIKNAKKNDAVKAKDEAKHEEKIEIKDMNNLIDNK